MAKTEVETILGCSRPDWPELGPYEPLLIDGDESVMCFSSETHNQNNPPGINQLDLQVNTDLKTGKRAAVCRQSTCKYFQRGNYLHRSSESKLDRFAPF